MFQIYFWNTTLHVSDSFSVHHQEYSTVHTAIGICHTGDADCLLASSQHHPYDIYLLLCVQCSTPDDGQITCPKHVELYSKNKFEKWVHLVGFIIRIYHDARSSECHIRLAPCHVCTDTWDEHTSAIFWVSVTQHPLIARCYHPPSPPW